MPNHNKPLTAQDTFLEALATLQDTAERQEHVMSALHRLLHPREDAPDNHTFTLTAAAPVEVFSERFRSIGIYNPNGIPLILGYGGGSARVGQPAPLVPASALLVLPLEGNQFEIGANPANLAAGDAIVTVFVYSSVQPAFLGVGV